jgi:hypothetical protein
MRVLVLALALGLAGCATVSSLPTANTTTDIQYSNTMEIIQHAADAAPAAVPGEYTLKIKAVGSDGSVVFLNTEPDYRDQRCVSIALHPKVVAQLTAKYGMTPEQYFTDKSITVKGKAQRMKIVFRTDGKLTGKYYYQTHIFVRELSQLDVVTTNVS